MATGEMVKKVCRNLPTLTRVIAMQFRTFCRSKCLSMFIKTRHLCGGMFSSGDWFD